MDHYDIAIVGAGLAGALAALALSRDGRSVALVAPAAPHDRRTTALMDEAIGFLGTLGLGEDVTALGAPLATLRIIDGTDRLLRAPVVTFRAAEIGLEAFGYNLPNAPLLDRLNERIAEAPSIARIEARLESLAEDATICTLRLADGRALTASLVIGADGRRSLVREARGIGTRNWRYPQTAVVLNFAHERPHENISTEFHTQQGPFTQVPLPGKRSSLVWVMTPEQAAEMVTREPAALSSAVEERMQSMLGKVAVDTEPQAFPLSGMAATHFGRGRVILVGEAAHAFPPIGAQGLNLSLRDVMTLVSMLAERPAIPGDIGDRYDRRRRADILSRTVSVDLLNRSLLTGFLPVQMLRTGGLQALSSAGALRSLVMQEGLRPGSAIRTMFGGLREKIGRHPA
ncbi:2-octaprenyl-6-methoxyphenol hydroxylase [Rhizobium sp. PP-F2F-G48]|uniref:UbiH/UbiF family hydroxylase n=1 Tax=Rhizobium sp. PP-F2F-G48 TaxID=2135651 RepID=UPI00104D9FAC|nr:UbiH/UbiF family hydroxylase [Rhizobium sp. PP-F2F-G48]TCM58989.1 2-octaprenyl-6-methoxyphenol hydroxylase [Rhizobium sp. PP-F2F-G48]